MFLKEIGPYKELIWCLKSTKGKCSFHFYGKSQNRRFEWYNISPSFVFCFLWKREEWFWSSWFADQEEMLKDERFGLKPSYNSDIDVPIHYFTIGSGKAFQSMSNLFIESVILGCSDGLMALEEWNEE